MSVRQGISANHQLAQTLTTPLQRPTLGEITLPVKGAVPTTTPAAAVLEMGIAWFVPLTEKSEGTLELPWGRAPE
jgi:hypothetical protein